MASATALSFLQTTYFRLLQTECFQTATLNLIKLAVLQEGRKHSWGKGEINCYEQFLLFPPVFSKDLYCRLIKTRACLGKG